MDAKKLLSEYIPATKYVAVCEAEISALWDTTLRSPKTDAMPKGQELGGLETTVAVIEAAERRLRKAIERAEALRDKCDAMIEGLESHDQKTVLRLRYMEGLYWYQIADEVGFSERQTLRIHGRALRELQRRENEV